MTRFFPLVLALVGVVTLAGFAGADRSAVAPVPPSTFEVDASHSFVGFKVRHLGLSSVTGRFNAYETALELDPDDLRTLEASARIDVASIDTENERRDNHLRSADFFDAENHPALTFESTGVQEVDGNRFKLAGDLTIRGTTRPVVLEGELVGVIDDPSGAQRVGIEAETTIDRRDFGLTWNRATEAGGLVVGHDVTIILEIAAVQRQEG